MKWDTHFNKWPTVRQEIDKEVFWFWLTNFSSFNGNGAEYRQILNTVSRPTNSDTQQRMQSDAADVYIWRMPNEQIGLAMGEKKVWIKHSYGHYNLALDEVSFWQLGKQEDWSRIHAGQCAAFANDNS